MVSNLVLAVPHELDRCVSILVFLDDGLEPAPARASARLLPMGVSILVFLDDGLELRVQPCRGECRDVSILVFLDDGLERPSVQTGCP